MLTSELRKSSVNFEQLSNMQYEIAQQLDPLYEYMEYQLVQANTAKNVSLLVEVKTMLLELRDTWHQAMKLARGQRAVGN